MKEKLEQSEIKEDQKDRNDWIIKLAEDISANAKIDGNLKALAFEAAVQQITGPINWL